MNKNDLLLLDQTLESSRIQRDPETPKDEFFEFFSAEQVLRESPLDPNDIKAGIVGQISQKTGSDGGIDSMYLIVNGRMIRDLEQAKALSALKQEIQFDIVCIQSKLSKGFELIPLIRFKDTAESIFDLQKPIENFGERYNNALLDTIRVFREAHAVLLPKGANIAVYFYYVARADSSVVHGDIKGKAGEIEERIPRLLSTVSKCKVEFIGARELFQRVHQRKPLFITLPCFEAIPDDQGGTFALVELGEYYKLITEGDQLRETLFESNVRDFQGDVEVNEQIKSTLERKDDAVGFWWLNNGITIISSKVGTKRRSVDVEDPQIVNGLQTSQVIFNHLKNQTDKTDKRLAVVRIIQSSDEAQQDRIIRATNSQTKIPIAALRASDEIQRDIEHAFRGRGMHYDRRKNSWRRTTLPLSSIVGMTELAQSFASIVLKEPDHARARPSRYFKDPHYNKVFRSGIDLQLYVVCAQLRKRMEAFLKTAEPDRGHRNNILFYCLMALGFQLAKKRMKLRDLDVASLKGNCFSDALTAVMPVYTTYNADDSAAKGTDMVTDLKAAFGNKTKKRPSRKQILDNL